MRMALISFSKFILLFRKKPNIKYLFTYYDRCTNNKDEVLHEELVQFHWNDELVNSADFV